MTVKISKRNKNLALSTFCRDTFQQLPRTQTSLSLSMKMCAQRKAGRRQRARLRLPMVPCGSSPVARLYLAKNEAPEEEEAVSASHHGEAKRQIQNAGHRSPMQVKVQVTVQR